MEGLENNGWTMVPVESSQLAAVGWQESELRVSFKNGSTYSYLGVPVEVYENLLAAPSAGKFFSAEVKNTYSGTKL